MAALAFRMALWACPLGRRAGCESSHRLRRQRGRLRGQERQIVPQQVPDWSTDDRILTDLNFMHWKIRTPDGQLSSDILLPSACWRGISTLVGGCGEGMGVAGAVLHPMSVMSTLKGKNLLHSSSLFFPFRVDLFFCGVLYSGVQKAIRKSQKLSPLKKGLRPYQGY